MNKKQVILIMIGLAIVMVLAFFSLTSWMRDAIIKEPVNFCGQTIDEANNPVNWHNGIYSPDGCNLIKK